MVALALKRNILGSLHAHVACVVSQHYNVPKINEKDQGLKMLSYPLCPLCGAEYGASDTDLSWLHRLMTSRRTIETLPINSFIGYY